MLTLRCTAKLLKQMRTTPDPTPPASTTRLGDWYANRIQVGRTPIVLAVSEKSLLPVLLPARGVAKLPELLPDAVAEVLAFLEIPEDAIRAEIAAMKEGCVVAKTASRVVLGSMNDMARMTEAHIRSGRPLQDTSRYLTTVPFSPLKMHAPAHETRALLGG